MYIKELYENFSLKEIDTLYIDKIRNSKSILSNTDKRFFEKILLKHKENTKEEVLKAMILYAIWNPDDCISYARKKGVFRYRIGNHKENNAFYYLENLIKYKTALNYSEYCEKYLYMKLNCKWMHDFYVKTEKKIYKKIEEHHKKRIRKNVRGNKLETSLFKELMTYMEILYVWVDLEGHETPDNRDLLTGYSKEEIGEGISYLISIYDDIIGIKEDSNYWIDSYFVFDKKIEELILLACKILHLQEWELLIDYFNYEITSQGNNWTIKCNNNLEKSIRMGYAKTEAQSELFFMDLAKNEKIPSLEEVSNMCINELESTIIKKVETGKLCRYIMEFPMPIVEKLKKNIKGYELFKEEYMALKYMEKEMVTEDEVFIRKKVTQHANMGDVLLMQRFFVLVYYIYKQVLLKEKDKHIIARTLCPVFEYKQFCKLVNNIVDDEEKTKELIDLFTYNKKTKLDLQYTPILRIGEKIYLSTSIIAMSNMLRNTISYSYMMKNQIVNNDNGMEPMVQYCVAAFEDSDEKCMVFSNKRFKYQGNSGEIDVLVISDIYILIIECKAPITPTSTFEMRSEYEHLLKAERQLNLSKKAFSDKGFRNKYLQSLGVEEKNREILTCILLGNRIFSCYTGMGHPIRCYHELNMILNCGVSQGALGKWRLWKEESYTSEDLMEFLSEKDSFVSKLQEALTSRTETMKCNGKIIRYETFLYDIVKAHRIIEKIGVCIEKGKLIDGLQCC